MNWIRPQMREWEISYQIEIYKEVAKIKKGWISNTDSFHVELIERLKELGFVVGSPQGTERYSSEQMTRDGLVGIYWRTK